MWRLTPASPISHRLPTMSVHCCSTKRPASRRRARMSSSSRSSSSSRTSSAILACTRGRHVVRCMHSHPHHAPPPCSLLRHFGLYQRDWTSYRLSSAKQHGLHRQGTLLPSGPAGGAARGSHALSWPVVSTTLGSVLVPCSASQGEPAPRKASGGSVVQCALLPELLSPAVLPQPCCHRQQSTPSPDRSHHRAHPHLNTTQFSSGATGRLHPAAKAFTPFQLTCSAIKRDQ